MGSPFKVDQITRAPARLCQIPPSSREVMLSGAPLISSLARALCEPPASYLEPVFSRFRLTRGVAPVDVSRPVPILDRMNLGENECLSSRNRHQVLKTSQYLIFIHSFRGLRATSRPIVREMCLQHSNTIQLMLQNLFAPTRECPL